MKLDVTTTVLVILTCVASMFVWALEGPDHVILDKLILWPNLVLDGQIWRIATWPASHRARRRRALPYFDNLVWPRKAPD